MNEHASGSQSRACHDGRHCVWPLGKTEGKSIDTSFTPKFSHLIITLSTQLSARRVSTSARRLHCTCSDALLSTSATARPAPTMSSTRTPASLTAAPDGIDKVRRAGYVVLATLAEHPTPHHARVTTAGQAWRIASFIVDAVALLALCTLGPHAGRWHMHWSWLTELRMPMLLADAGQAAAFRTWSELCAAFPHTPFLSLPVA